jgi:DNA repair exonuclease SbcCD ATPase subunit
MEAAMLKEQLAAATGDAQRLREQLESQPSPVAPQAQSDEYLLQLEQLQSDRELWRDELATMRSQLERLAEARAADTQVGDAWAEAHEELSQLRSELSTLAPDAASTAELESYRTRVAALDEERRTWREEMRQLREQLQALAQTSGQPSEPLVELREELIQLREAITAPAATDKQAAGQLESYRQQLESLQSDRAAWYEELAQLRMQLGSLVDAANHEGQLRQQLAAAEADLAASRDRVAAEPDTHQQLAAEQVHREQLEGELDALRLRGAELAEALDEQKRLAAAEREKWSEELRQLRRALERQTEFLAQRLAAAGTVQASSPESMPPAAGNGRAPSGARANDVVVGAVLEQFEQLQKSKVRKLASNSQP